MTTRRSLAKIGRPVACVQAVCTCNGDRTRRCECCGRAAIVRHASSAAETSWPFSPAPSTPRPPPPLGPLANRLSSTLLAPSLSSAMKRSTAALLAHWLQHGAGRRAPPAHCRVVRASAGLAQCQHATAARAFCFTAPPTRPFMAHVLSLKPAAPRSPVSCMCTPLTWLAALSTVAGALAGGHPARPSRADRAFYSLRCHGDAIVPRTALSRASRLALTAPARVASLITEQQQTSGPRSGPAI